MLTVNLCVCVYVSVHVGEHKIVDTRYQFSVSIVLDNAAATEKLRVLFELQ